MTRITLETTGWKSSQYQKGVFLSYHLFFLPNWLNQASAQMPCMFCFPSSKTSYIHNQDCPSSRLSMSDNSRLSWNKVLFCCEFSFSWEGNTAVFSVTSSVMVSYSSPRSTAIWLCCTPEVDGSVFRLSWATEVSLDLVFLPRRSPRIYKGKKFLNRADTCTFLHLKGIGGTNSSLLASKMRNKSIRVSKKNSCSLLHK